jgi:hypothetical protein
LETDGLIHVLFLQMCDRQFKVDLAHLKTA